MGAELGRMDAVALADLVRRGDLSAVESFELAAERIRHLNPSLNAVLEGFDPRVWTCGPQPDTKGLLAGVPLLLKDSIDVAGQGSTQGSWAIGNAQARDDAEWVSALRAAGCLPIGRTNMAEFGLLDVTEPLRYGATRNPWRFDATVGGSSGGSAAAVASGMVPIAHGTDGGGSIRYPAACCGVFGFKPSRGRTTPSLPSFDERLPSTVVHHVISRSVRDSALVFAITAARCQHQAERAEQGWVRDPVRRKLRVAVITEPLHGGEVAPSLLKATEFTAGLLWDLGHEVVFCRWPIRSRAFHDAFFDRWAMGVQVEVARMGSAARAQFESRVEPWTLGLAAHAATLAADRLESIVAECRGASDAMKRFHQEWDVLLTPIAAASPVNVGEHAPDLPFAELWQRVKHNVGFTPLQSATGQPAMSLPLYWDDAGQPVGVQMAAAIGADELLFGLAYQLEAACPWSARWLSVAERESA